MKNVEGWSVGDLKAPIKGIDRDGSINPDAAEPVYYTKRYVAPSVLYLQDDQKIASQVYNDCFISY